jgi:hypothetical protein
VVIEDANQRRTALTALQRWMASSAEAVSGVPQATSDDNQLPRDPDVPRDADIPRVAHVPPDAPARSTSAHGPQDIGFVTGHDFSRAATPATSIAALAAAPADASPHLESSNGQAQIGPPTPIPSGF